MWEIVLHRPGNRFAIDLALVVFGSVVSYAFAIIAIDAVIVDGDILPFGNDAFYHARRILDAATGHAGLQQFDPLMHMPEGSWVSWPWAYDRLLASIVQLGMWLSPATEPMKILIYVPVAWIPVNVLLLLAIFNAIDLRTEFKALGIAGFALSPFTQRLHGIGAIDHHFMELTFVLLVTWLLLRWMSQPHSQRTAIACGLALGIAQAFHHGLFILQLPVLLTLFVLWFRDALPPTPTVRALALAVLGSTVLIALPSGPLLDGQFSLATLSLFHPYVALCTASLIFCMSTWQYSPRAMAGLVTLGIVLAIPGSAELLLASKFLTGQLTMLDQIVEMQSPMTMIRGSWGLAATVGTYSWLLLLVPVMLLAGLYLALTDARPRHIAYGVLSVFGLGLLLMQMRLNYFGLCFMLAGPLYFLSRYSPVESPKRALVFLASLVVFAIAFRPPLSGQLFSKHAIAADHLYEVTRPLYQALQAACAAEPGTVVAAPQFGHYIRYHTACSVVANNFLLTEQHFEKVNRVNSMFQLPIDDLATRAPDVRYVLTFLANTYEQREGRVYLRDLSDLRASNPTLINELMLTDSQSAHAETLQEVYVDPEAEHKIPLAGVYRIRK